VSTKSLLLWDVARSRLVVTDVSVQVFGPNFKGQTVWERRLSWISWPLKRGSIGCPETSVSNYQSTLRNIPEKPTAISLVVTRIAHGVERICAISTDAKNVRSYTCITPYVLWCCDWLSKGISPHFYVQQLEGLMCYIQYAVLCASDS